MKEHGRSCVFFSAVFFLLEDRRRVGWCRVDGRGEVSAGLEG